MSGFLDINAHPKAQAIAEDFLKLTRFIVPDIERAAANGRFAPWPQEEINAGGWHTFALKWQGLPIADARSWYAGKLASYEPAIWNAGYSLMMPGARILPHTGITTDVLRMHIGLVVPKAPGCTLTVGGETRRWTERGVLLFDDMVEHSAENATSEPRVILLLDLLKRML